MEEKLIPVSMAEAVGYAALVCESQTPAENPLVLKHGRYFLLSNSHGDIAPSGHCSLGLFENDTRILSHYALKMRGGTPSLLSMQAPHSYIGQIDLTITDSEFDGNNWDPKNCVHIGRQLLIADRLVERVTFTNYLPSPIDYWVELSLAADFADMFEIRGWKREKRGQYFAPQIGRNSIVFAYEGLDGSVIKTRVQFHQPPTELSAGVARWRFDLPPNTPFRLEWEVAGEQSASFRSVWTGFGLDEQRKLLDETYSEWTSECTRWSTSPSELQDLLVRATDDLYALYTDSEESRVITAGIPWYSTAFGRDSIITSIEALSLNPSIAIDTLRYLARHQGAREDAFTEEQPGKIMHELRRGEMARNREIPHVPYYGTIDATPLWLILLHETWLWTGDDALVRELLPTADRALEWIRKFGDIDGDGFVEYVGSSTGKGLANQGWKDSGDGVPMPDAALPSPPIALIEVQGYVYDAFKRMAALFKSFGRHAQSDALAKRADKLRERIIESYWIDELGMFALALDGHKKAVPTMTSNAGHLLWSGVPEPWQAERLVEQLMGPQMFSGWGIRTLSAAHRVFNPMSYHNGSVWPHDNAIVVMGCARYGYASNVLPVLRGLNEAATHEEFHRLPELFCGMQYIQGMHPVWYPVSCSPQAWASGAFFMLLQAVLGLH
ncbi:MAG TPA: glycogen debranching N-terminal domain-containing protein, partial [Chthoniobacteraceae bacterium]|nr:glycogen debranching N-terminal domain-containing protein [Chthoniobacteraceae bacterium]